jgi:hypothetical protein
MIFRTKLDGPASRNTARQGVDAAYGIPDNVGRLGAAIEGSNPPKRPPSCAYNAPTAIPLFAGAKWNTDPPLA